MTGKLSIGEVVPLPVSAIGRAGDLAAVVLGRAQGAAEQANLDNVIPFARPRNEAARAPEVKLPPDTQPRASGTRERMRLAAFVAVSLAVHGGLFAAFWREPEPLASIGLEVISVEIMLGAPAPAGVAPTPGENQVNAAAAPDTEATEIDKADEKATEQPQQVEVAKQESAPEQKTEPPRTEEARREEPKTETAAAPDETAQAEPKPTVAMVESPSPDTPTSTPRETPPESTEVTLTPQPEKPADKRPEAKPVKTAAPKPVKDARPAKEPRRIAAPTREKAAKEAKASQSSTAANNVGIGSSARDTNYPGLVSAHLRRYQQYPSDARSRGDQGTATVSFSLDGGGRVTSARLARGSGIASIDREVQAMVRRASPFPAPPGGRPQSFTVPVAFRLN